MSGKRSLPGGAVCRDGLFLWGIFLLIAFHNEYTVFDLRDLLVYPVQSFYRGEGGNVEMYEIAIALQQGAVIFHVVDSPEDIFRPDGKYYHLCILLAAADDPSYHDAYANHFANVWRSWLLSL